jgi:hypothetical protein
LSAKFNKNGYLLVSILAGLRDPAGYGYRTHSAARAKQARGKSDISKGEFAMNTITVSFTEDELQSFCQAYLVLQNFVEKVLPAEELYDQEFLEGMREAAQDIRTGQTMEVHSFDDFAS